MHFSFVIPLIHPANRRVKDYERTLRALRATLENLSQQTYHDISVVVVCHALPDWRHDIDPRIHFLLMAEHPELPFQAFSAYNNEASEVDKGIKLALGFAYASDRLHADYAMMMDADDFARTDLVHRVLTFGLPKIGRDGWNITRGYNLEMDHTAHGLILRSAYEVEGFHRNCGSCRIFLSKALNGHFEKIAPSFAQYRDQIPRAADGMIKRELIEALLSDIRSNTSQNAPFMVFAYHKRQERLFDLADVDQLLMAKGCGHSNHAGQSDIFWYRVVRQCDVASVVNAFGLDDSALISSEPDPINHVNTRMRSLVGKVRQVPPSVRARIGWLAAR